MKEDIVRRENKRGMHNPLILTLDHLYNPRVGLEDNSPFCLTDQEIGTFYAFFATTAPNYISPGKMVASHTLPSHAVEEFQKRFQQATRLFFYQMLGKLESRMINRDEALRTYVPKIIPSETFASGSIERMVLEMASQERFTDIGQALHEGARQYQQDTQIRKMDNYRIVAEYKRIREALSK
ncbi:MAG: hypothetical protein AABX04_06780 [Nanoarchaeota archaeon]